MALKELIRHWGNPEGTGRRKEALGVALYQRMRNRVLGLSNKGWRKVRVPYFMEYIKLCFFFSFFFLPFSLWIHNPSCRSVAVFVGGITLF